ncbi:50S ribosomal protein L6 [Candidatus Parcubacteria bacterium]|nr:50S ribosomal protein L6 [Candidatus Parcubacteria bacterium]
MSRIGKKVIEFPEKTEVTVSGSTVSVKGPKGTLQRDLTKNVAIDVAARTVTLTPLSSNLEDLALWGTYASHIVNMVKGVNESFTKKLIIEGIGFKAEVKGTDLVLALGFSHPVKKPIPTTLKVTSDKGIVTITGMNKEEVGQFAAEIRALKKPEPYKGKGIRYEGEVIRRKQGKKSV